MAIISSVGVGADHKGFAINILNTGIVTSISPITAIQNIMKPSVVVRSIGAPAGVSTVNGQAQVVAIPFQVWG